MKKHSEKTIRLHVNAGDELTEISVIDKRFNRLGSGLGSLTVELVPGFYKVRWKTATASEDKLIEITGQENNGVRRLELEVQPITTSAPLANTTFGCLDKPQVLQDLSGKAPARDAHKRAQLLVFLRDETAGGEAFPAQSLSIHTADGTRVADFSDGFVNDEERYAGFNIGLEAGVYRLRVETGPLGVYEIFVCTAEGWQTRVFLTCDEFYAGKETFRRPMLRTTSILMARLGERFNPKSHDARLAEVALNALVRGYDILGSRDMRGLLHGKFDDPMLGIYGAHLLLRRKRVNWDVFDTVCRNLLRLVGPVPDVQALFVKSKQPMQADKDRLALYEGLPPMLIRSWDLLVRRSRKRYSIIPPDSLSDRIAGAVVSTEPWLMCRVEEQAEAEVEAMPNVSYAEGKRVLEQMVARVGLVERERLSDLLAGGREELNPIESAILNAVVMVEEAGKPDDSGMFSTAQIPEFVREPAAQYIDTVGIAKQALSNLPAPSYSIARSAVSLASKLKDKFDFDIS